ncbi:hypothetical protein G7Z17_g12651 [Cylindrodendrum hubeiense]|uniref:Mis6 domain protein n=1 Tax=Cylindrodendrum hubeiense TaxID=595255 RepID=A0A9P5L5B0_9HYPO|nr:hypothetical protein G7Z17_g12651 [Cylindrodendrum hubeiense]
MDPAHDEIRLLARDVVEASKLPTKSRTSNIKPTVANLTSLFYEWGVLPDTLDDLINLVTTPSHLDQASLSAITRNLYPAEPVSRDVVLRVVSCLGHGKIKPSLPLQAALLRWLIMVYHALESPPVLSEAYPVLFNLLDTAATRLTLSRQTGNDPCLVGLLRVFKDYYPEVIVGEATKSKRRICNNLKKAFPARRMASEFIDPSPDASAINYFPSFTHHTQLSDEADQRIANWLNSALQDVIDGDSEESMLFDVLDILRDYVVSSQLYLHIFKPLENVTLNNTPESQLALLSLYKNLLHHWTSILHSNDHVPENATGIVTALISHANPLALALAQTSPTMSTHSAILEFYEQNVRLVSHDILKQYIRIELPPPALVYILLFSSSLAIVSRMCNVLACYRKGFDIAMQTKARHNSSNRIDSASYNRAYVDLYNGFLMDICNCFWRGRAFTDNDTNALGCMVPRSLVPTLTTYVSSVDKTFSLDSIFGLSYSPVVCLQSIRVVRELEDAGMEKDRSIRTRHAGPVTQSSLTRLSSSGGITLSWKDYRVDVLATLSANELPGITELLKNTMKVVRSLMEGKETQSSTQ